jgi:hypothetical protein
VKRGGKEEEELNDSTNKVWGSNAEYIRKGEKMR